MQKLTEKAYVEISLYYEVKSAAIFGGSSDVGYVSVSSGNISNFELLCDEEKLTKMMEESRLGIAKFLGVAPQNVRHIDREEFIKQTDEDG